MIRKERQLSTLIYLPIDSEIAFWPGILSPLW